MAGSRVKGITIQIDGETTGLDKALSSVNSNASKTNTELRDVNKLLKLDPGNTELVAQKQQLLAKAVNNTEDKLQILKSAQNDVQAAFDKGDIGEDKYRAFQRELQATEGSLKNLQNGLSNTEAYLKGSGDEAALAEAGFRKAKSGMDDLNDSAETIKNMGLADAFNQVGEKAAEIGGDVIDTGMQFADAQSLMQNSMGLTKEQAEQATQSVHDVFNSGLVSDVNEASEAVMTVKNSFQDLNGQDLTNLTNQLLAVSKHGGIDIQEATNAASQAMKGFGITGKEATDLVAKGLQDGLNKNDDFLDTVNEYAPTFKDAGMSAGSMLSVLNAGMENGAFNTDKVADSIKEFQLRLTSGQLDEPMQQFGQETQDVFQKFKDGQATTAEVMASVGNDLKNMPADKAKAAVQGLGTQFEDLGQNASAALLQAATGTEEVNGAADKMAQKTPGEKMQGSINKLKEALASFMDKMTPVIDGISKLVDAFVNAPGPIQTLIGVIGAVMAVLAILMPVITTIATVIGAFGAGVILPFIGIVAGIIGVITAVILIFQNWGAIGPWLQGVWTAVVEWIQTAWSTLLVNAQYIFWQISQTISTVFNSVSTFISNVWNSIINFVTSLWNGMVNTVQAVFSSISQTISNVFNGVASFISNVWNGISNAISSVLSGIRTTITNVWNNIRNAISNIMNGISNVISSVWNGITNTISNVVNGIRSTISNVFGGIAGIVRGAFDGARNAASDVLNGMWNIISGIVDRIKSVFNFRLKFPDIDIPKIPLPHFKLSGEFNPLKGKIPKLDVDWYAKGGIFTKPTLFATDSGIKGVGEAGPEAVLPLNRQTLAGIGAGIAAEMGSNQKPSVVIHQTIVAKDSPSEYEVRRAALTAMKQVGYQYMGGVI